MSADDTGWLSCDMFSIGDFPDCRSRDVKQSPFRPPCEVENGVVGQRLENLRTGVYARENANAGGTHKRGLNLSAAGWDDAGRRRCGC
jgi:hypothetical protein